MEPLEALLISRERETRPYGEDAVVERELRIAAIAGHYCRLWGKEP
jgi:hypothetical protein